MEAMKSGNRLETEMDFFGTVLGNGGSARIDILPLSETGMFGG
jgi:hypothetical protein